MQNGKLPSYRLVSLRMPGEKEAPPELHTNLMREQGN